MRTATKTSKSNPGNPERLRGRVERLFFSAPQFTAGRLEVGSRDSIAFAGPMMVQVGDSIVLHGHWTTHKQYGRQFQVECYEYDMPIDVEGLVNYLANNPNVKGIGPAKARLIAERFGRDFETALDNHAEEIADIAGVKIETVALLKSEWNRNKSFNSALTWLSAFGLTHHQVTLLVEKFENNVIAVLKANPYLLVKEIRGFGFKRVDAIALKMGVVKDYPDRIRAGIKHCIDERIDAGDCWVDYEELVNLANHLLIMDCLDSRERIEQILDQMIDANELECISHNGRFLIARPDLYSIEKDLEKWFRKGSDPNPHFAEVADMAALIQQTTPLLNVGQRKAVLSALSHRISLMSGGAGSGKTFTVAAIADLYKSRDLIVILAAPTGKAAKRLEQVVGQNAFTIHRLLGYQGHQFTAGPDTPINADVVIIDECFDYRQNILTENGWKMIGTIVNQRKPMNVWSRNPSTGQVELKPIVRWLKHQAPNELLLITASRSNSMRNARQIRCTRDHKVLTPYGYRRASELLPGEELIVRGSAFSPSQRSVLIGSLLGDGCMTGAASNSAIVVLSQGEAQKTYLQFKQCVFGSLASDLKCNLSGYANTKVWKIQLKSTDETVQIQREMISCGEHPSGRRRWAPTDQFLKWIDEQALAIWFLDNGSITTRELVNGDLRYDATIHSQRFRYEDNLRIASFMKDRFGLSPNVAPDSRGFWLLRFNCSDTERLLKIVAPFVPNCMSYKSPFGSTYEHRPELDVQTCIATVQKVEVCKPSSSDVFDIEVADNHNFIAGNIVVSNCSMVDVSLAWHLFRAIDPEKTAVVLVGDHNQLPPVGPGNILRDLLETGLVPGVILDQVVRQAGVLKENSIAILQGEVRKTAVESSNGRRPWYLVDQFADILDIQTFITELYQDILSDKLKFDLLRDVQLLTPTKKGPLGTDALNVILQQVIQKKLFGIDVLPPKPGRRPKFLRHDRVIQTRNNYDLDVMNGATGIVEQILSGGGLLIDFDGKHVEVEPGENMADISLAYCLTTHKSQGSEYPCVVTVIHKAHTFMHNRNLFYTGVTRARQSAIVIGDRWGLRNCATRKLVDKRKTFLSMAISGDGRSGAAGL